MPRKPKVTHVVEAVIVSCSEHGVFMIPFSECNFTGGETECEMCGSHGSVDLEVTCPGCALNLKPKQLQLGKAKAFIELKSW